MIDWVVENLYYMPDKYIVIGICNIIHFITMHSLHVIYFFSDVNQQSYQSESFKVRTRIFPRDGIWAPIYFILNKDDE